MKLAVCVMVALAIFGWMLAEGIGILDDRKLHRRRDAADAALAQAYERLARAEQLDKESNL